MLPLPLSAWWSSVAAYKSWSITIRMLIYLIPRRALVTVWCDTSKSQHKQEPHVKNLLLLLWYRTPGASLPAGVQLLVQPYPVLCRGRDVLVSLFSSISNTHWQPDRPTPMLSMKNTFESIQSVDGSVRWLGGWVVTDGVVAGPGWNPRTHGQAFFHRKSPGYW